MPSPLVLAGDWASVRISSDREDEGGGKRKRSRENSQRYCPTEETEKEMKRRRGEMSEMKERQQTLIEL